MRNWVENLGHTTNCNTNCISYSRETIRSIFRTKMDSNKFQFNFNSNTIQLFLKHLQILFLCRCVSLSFSFSENSKGCSHFSLHSAHWVCAIVMQSFLQEISIVSPCAFHSGIFIYITIWLESIEFWHGCRQCWSFLLNFHAIGMTSTKRWSNRLQFVM